MRKLDAAVACEPFGDGGLRLRLKTATGEGFLIDLDSEAARRHHDAVVGAVNSRREKAAEVRPGPVSKQGSPTRTRRRKSK
jgi:hypothetical protein